MTTTLLQGQADLPKLVELASRGEDVLITVDGQPKARLTRADAPPAGAVALPVDMAVWLKVLEEARHKYSTGKPGPSGEQILEADRADRI
jgi:antitoxin (DNA-binding transcriptional repressor) of toxin-antitoxin stability system